jgi:uncharacterized membrane protein YcgQ (UPF0703/DUF1980 family)
MKFTMFKTGILLFTLSIFFNLDLNFRNETIGLNNPTFVQATDTVTWEMLSKVKYKRKEHEEYGLVNFPMFSNELKELRGKTIIISGYIIPLDSETYVLSRYVYASCFFCGGAGAESIMGISFANLKKRLKTDQYVTLKGQLYLNEDDVNDWMFQIDKAEIIKGL